MSLGALACKEVELIRGFFNSVSAVRVNCHGVETLFFEISLLPECEVLGVDVV